MAEGERANEAVGQVCSREQQHGQGSLFLGLPTELRVDVYERLLEEMVRKPLHPWDALPTRSRFEVYPRLLLTNRQVREEMESLFRKHFAHRLLFHFDTVPDLYHFAMTHARLSAVRDARVSLRFNKHSPRRDNAGMRENCELSFITDHVHMAPDVLKARLHRLPFLGQYAPWLLLVSAVEAASYFKPHIAREMLIKHCRGPDCPAFYTLHIPIQDDCQGKSQVTGYYWGEDQSVGGQLKWAKGGYLVLESDLQALCFDGYCQRLRRQEETDVTT